MKLQSVIGNKESSDQRELLIVLITKLDGATYLIGTMHMYGKTNYSVSVLC